MLFDRHVLEELLDLLVDFGGSDLHLIPDERPRFRVMGELRSLDDFAPIDGQRLSSFLFEFMPRIFQGSGRIEDFFQADFSYEARSKERFRVNVFKERRGLAAAFRHIPKKVPSPQELFIPPDIVKLADLTSGLVLVTGPTGSGKSTTLACLIEHINASRRCRVITIEDPVEFVYENRLAVISQREVHQHVDSFAAALRAAMREDPDVILVGEMRDVETIRLALEAAQTGHLVFATLHTSGAAQALSRIIFAFPANQQDLIASVFAEAFGGVVYQRLLRHRDGTRRIPIFEFIKPTTATKNSIRNKTTHQIFSLSGKDSGAFPLTFYLSKVYQRGLVTAEEIISIFGEDVFSEVSIGE